MKTSKYYQIPQDLRDHWDGTRLPVYGGPFGKHVASKCRWCPDGNLK